MPAHSYPGKNVLIVEDDFATRAGLSSVLESAGCCVRGAANGREALDLLRAGDRPDLILLDLTMPVLDGWQFREEQQSDPNLAHIPVVVVSGSADLDRQSCQLRAAAVVPKPVELEHLLDVIGGLVTPRANALLIVDDEPQVRQLLALALSHHDIPTWTAAGGREAVELYRQHREEIGAVLLDVLMPDLDGPKTLAALRAIHPHVRCCFMSGHTGDYSPESLLEMGALHIFQKPFGLAELARTVQRLLRGAPIAP